MEGFCEICGAPLNEDGSCPLVEDHPKAIEQTNLAAWADDGTRGFNVELAEVLGKEKDEADRLNKEIELFYAVLDECDSREEGDEAD